MATTAAVLFLLLNVLFFTMVSSTYVPCPPASKPPSGGGHRHGRNPAKTKCPKDTLKFGVCAKLLNDVTSIVVGTPPKIPCCSLIDGLSDLKAAVCLCTALKANVLSVKLTASLSLTLLLSYCGKNVPSGFDVPKLAMSA